MKTYKINPATLVEAANINEALDIYHAQGGKHSDIEFPITTVKKKSHYPAGVQYTTREGIHTEYQSRG